MRATQHLHRGILLTMAQQKKRISGKHNEMVLSFCFFWKKPKKKKKKQKQEKLFTRESSQQAKEEQGNPFGFSFKYYNKLN